MKYTVTKYFGHFSQSWLIDAENEEEAWENAEKGTMLSLDVYVVPFEKKGYIVAQGETVSVKGTVSHEWYYSWLNDAVENGMVLPERYLKKLEEWRLKKTNK